MGCTCPVQKTAIKSWNNFIDSTLFLLVYQYVDHPPINCLNVDHCIFCIYNPPHPRKPILTSPLNIMQWKSPVLLLSSNTYACHQYRPGTPNPGQMCPHMCAAKLYERSCCIPTWDIVHVKRECRWCEIWISERAFDYDMKSGIPIELSTVIWNLDFESEFYRHLFSWTATDVVNVPSIAHV